MPYDLDPDPARRARVEEVVRAYESLSHQVALAHAPEFLGVGVTMSQAKVLYLVQAQPGIRMSEIAAKLGISVSTLSGMLDRLVDQGLLTRHDDPADRRQVLLRVTDTGVAEVEHMREMNAHHFRMLLARVEDRDLDVVERALDVLAAAHPDLHVGADSAPGRPTTPGATS